MALRPYLSFRYLNQWVTWNLLLRFLTICGGWWLLVEISSFFYPQAALAIRPYFWPLLGGSVLGALAWCRPRLAVSARIVDRDVRIEILVKDVFELEEALVVPMCRRFETADVARQSIQGQVIDKFYGGDQTKLAKELGMTSQQQEHAIGTVKIGNVKIDRVTERTLYFLALTTRNHHGNTRCTFADVGDALAGLWNSVASAGDTGAIVIPVLGTGRGRVAETRERVIHEIVQSFVAACASAVFCQHLKIAIGPDDFAAHGIDLTTLERYLEHVCTYTRFVDREPAIGPADDGPQVSGDGSSAEEERRTSSAVAPITLRDLERMLASWLSNLTDKGIWDSRGTRRSDIVFFAPGGVSVRLDRQISRRNLERLKGAISQIVEVDEGHRPPWKECEPGETGSHFVVVTPDGNELDRKGIYLRRV